MLRFNSRRTFSCARRVLRNEVKSSVDESGQVTMKVEPIKRTGETVEVKRARLVYQSRKRGILESDLLLSRFAKKYLNTFSEQELEEYDKLLDEPDWDIYYWATKNYDTSPLPDKWKNSKVLQLLQKDAQNEEREILRMPDLH